MSSPLLYSSLARSQVTHSVRTIMEIFLFTKVQLHYNLEAGVCARVCVRVCAVILCFFFAALQAKLISHQSVDFCFGLSSRIERRNY